jgi:hypothetical protein
MATAAEYSRTGAHTANLPGRRFDHVFFTSMALVMLATVFVGFAHTIILPASSGRRCPAESFTYTARCFPAGFC